MILILHQRSSRFVYLFYQSDPSDFYFTECLGDLCHPSLTFQIQSIVATKIKQIINWNTNVNTKPNLWQNIWNRVFFFLKIWDLKIRQNFLENDRRGNGVLLCWKSRFFKYSILKRITRRKKFWMNLGLYPFQK